MTFALTLFFPNIYDTHGTGPLRGHAEPLPAPRDQVGVRRAAARLHHHVSAADWRGGSGGEKMMMRGWDEGVG